MRSEIVGRPIGLSLALLVAALAAAAGVPGIPLAGKPFAWAFRRALRLLGDALPATTAMVGDQLFTGHGLATDIVEASAKAYIAALSQAASNHPDTVLMGSSTSRWSTRRVSSARYGTSGTNNPSDDTSALSPVTYPTTSTTKWTVPARL